MEAPAILAVEQQVWNQAVLDHVRRAPFAGDHRVVAEMPPEIVGEVLRPSVHLPLAEHVEGVVVEEEDPSWPLAVGRTERADVDSFWAAMDRMESRVAGAGEDLLRLDDPDQLWLSGIGLRIENVDTRRAKAGYDQVPSLDVRVWCVRTE